MRSFEQMINWLLGDVQDTSPLQELPLVAYLWNGGASSRYEVKSINSSRAFIVAGDHWYPGTIINLAFQIAPGAGNQEKQFDKSAEAILMRAKVTASWAAGVDVQFLYVNEQERNAFKKLLANAEAMRKQPGQK